MDILQLSTKSIAQVNININLVIRRRVNANASPDVPKPLYQREGGCASFPLIQSFGCTDSARALRRTGIQIYDKVSTERNRNRDLRLQQPTITKPIRSKQREYKNWYKMTDTTNHMMRIQPLNNGRTKSWKFDGHAERDHICEEEQEKRLSQVKERPNGLSCRQR